jgi:hypothetical protein
MSRRSIPRVSVVCVLLASLAYASLLVADNKSYPASEQLWQKRNALYMSRNYAGAMPVLVEAARLNDARAQALLGRMYQEGTGVRVDERVAAEYFGKAAAQGHRASQYAIGSMYEYGKGGLPQDYRKAAEFYTASAQQGFGAAQYALGLLYEFGHGVPRNRAKAFSWFNAAAAQGDGDAAWLLTWLRRPDTPSFSDEEHLAGYISAKVYASTPHPPPGRGNRNPIDCGPVISHLSCVQQLEQQRIRQQNEAAGIKNYQP